MTVILLNEGEYESRYVSSAYLVSDESLTEDQVYKQYFEYLLEKYLDHGFKVKLVNKVISFEVSPSKKELKAFKQQCVINGLNTLSLAYFLGCVINAPSLNIIELDNII